MIGKWDFTSQFQYQQLCFSDNIHLDFNNCARCCRPFDELRYDNNLILLFSAFLLIKIVFLSLFWCDKVGFTDVWHR